MKQESPIFNSVSMMEDNVSEVPTRRREWPNTNNHDDHRGASSMSGCLSSATGTGERNPQGYPISPKSIREVVFDGAGIGWGSDGRQTLRSAGAPSWQWRLDTAQHLPMFYPIQEWNTIIVDYLPLESITARISEFLRFRSIAANYNDKEGFVRCRTMSGVEFVINVWEDSREKNHNNNNDNKNSYLVHVQHICGCSMELHFVFLALKTTILDSAALTPENEEGAAYDNGGDARGSLTPEPATPPDHVLHSRIGHADGVASSSDGHTENNEEATDHSKERSPLEFSRCLLHSKVWSERRLGLESLAILTDRSKTIPCAARRTSFAVLSDSDLQNVLMSFFAINQNEHNKNGQGNQNLILSLRIVLQSLQNLGPHDVSCVIPATDASGETFWEVLLATLLSSIQNAPDRPLEACLSVKCFGQLLERDPSIISFAAKGTKTGVGLSQSGGGGDDDTMALEESLRTAHAFGRNHNLLLQMESERLLGRLSSWATAAR